MIKVLYGYKKNDPLTPFVDRQIRETDLTDTVFSSFDVDKNERLVDHYGITYHHTAIIRDHDGEEIVRLEGPFSSNELREAIDFSKFASALVSVRKVFGL